MEVFGYLDKTTMTLFLTSDHAEIGDYSSGITVADTLDLDIDNSDCSGYVRVRGRRVKDSFGLFYIGGVTQIVNTRSNEACMQVAP